jgi:hypothetical protein
LVAAINKKAAQPLAPSHSCTPSLPTPNSGPSTIFCGSKEKRLILEEYISKFGSGYRESIITKKKGKLDHNEPLQSLASSPQCMKPSTNKYYQVKELTIYNVITIVIREYAAFSTKELSNIRLLNTNFEKMIPKGILLALHEAIHRQVLPSKGVDNIQCHHNSHQRIRGFLQEQVGKHPSVEYRLCGDDTQAPMMASDRLFFVTQAGIELRKSNTD